MLLFFIACEKQIYFPIDEGELKIVVSGVVNPDSVLVIAVSSSQRLLIGDDPYAPSPDSLILDQIKLYEDNQFIGNLDYLERIFYYLPEFKPQAGKTYRIEVTADERNPASAITSVPENVPINYIDTSNIINEEGSKVVVVEIQISDPIGQENYYALQIFGTQKYYDRKQDVFVDSLVRRYYHPKKLNGKSDEFLDVFFLDVNQDVRLDHKLFFSDQMFDGKDFLMKFEFTQNYRTHMPDSILLHVGLQQIDKSYYKYAVSEQKYRNSLNNPFAEPVQVYSNVKEGYGIFTSFNESSREILVDW